MPRFGLIRIQRTLPLAWLLLKRQPVRLVAALFGVAFAGILILMQLGFQAALFNSSVSIVEKFDADLVIVGRQSVSLTGLTSFPEDRIARLAGNTAVQSVTPIRWRYVRWRLQDSPESRLAIAIGINPFQSGFADKEIESQQNELTQTGRILYDRLSRPEFGPVRDSFLAGQEVVAFASDQRLRVAGLASLGPSFGYDASFIASIETIDSIFNNNPGTIELGLIKLKPGIDPSKIAPQIKDILTEDVTLMTKKEFMDNERNYWNTSKPIGFAFAFSSLMSLAVGGMMVYQLLYTDVSFHLPMYAVLLSIGYHRSRLERIIFVEGIILSSLGFPISFLISYGLNSIVRNYTSLPMKVSLDITATTFGLIVSMCAVSALLAMNKLRDADPSDLFT